MKLPSNLGKGFGYKLKTSFFFGFQVQNHRRSWRYEGPTAPRDLQKAMRPLKHVGQLS